MPTGILVVNVYSGTIALPIQNALVEIIGTDLQFNTNSSGRTEEITLEAPDPSYANDPNSQIKPFATYDIRITKAGMVPTIINNVEIYAGITSRQDVFLVSKDEEDKGLIEIDLDDPTLWGDYAPKILDEEPVKSSITPFVLPRAIVPEYIIVHDGTPTNTSASNYYVLFTDYIKNVACSEIYPTWPLEAIKANVSVIVSFTLNRIYTEWYRSKGYHFTITSTTAYDQKYTHGRTIYDSIAKVVDQYFNEFIQFPGRNEPYLAHYNDGKNTNNPGWLSQWGSKDLADRGYNSLQILKYYYGNNLNLRRAEIAENLPTSFPGYNLQLGSCGEDVLYLQNQLNIIRGSYPAIPIIRNPNGEFDQQTETAVRTFQQYFGPSVTGIVDFATWYKISYYYLAVSEMNKSVTT